MKRRAIIGSLGASVAAGLAGCAALGGGCRTPSSDIHGALPRGGDYEETLHTVEQIEKPDDGELLLYARYRDGQDRLLVFETVEWTSPEAASDYVEEFGYDNASEETKVGRLRVGAYTYDGFGPSRESVVSLLAASDLLSRACVESGIVWE